MSTKASSKGGGAWGGGQRGSGGPRGLAFDHLVRHEESLSPDERSILRDWDEKPIRPRYLSLRDKLLQYQRLVTGSQHARLQENNCPEITRFLQVVDLIRNPLAHPSPHFDLDTGRADKQLALDEFRLGWPTRRRCDGAAREIGDPRPLTATAGATGSATPDQTGRGRRERAATLDLTHAPWY